MHRISLKFDRPMWTNEKTSWVVLFDDVTNRRCLISNLCHNFGVDYHFFAKFGTEMENLQPKGPSAQKSGFCKMQYGGRPPSWISNLGHNQWRSDGAMGDRRGGRPERHFLRGRKLRVVKKLLCKRNKIRLF